LNHQIRLQAPSVGLDGSFYGWASYHRSYLEDDRDFFCWDSDWSYLGPWGCLIQHVRNQQHILTILFFCDSFTKSL
jgi:hypothetical protein